MSNLLIDTGLGVSNSGAIADIVRRATQAEALGYAALWTSETQHDPFLPLALAAEHSTRITLGTAIAVAFALHRCRSPCRPGTCKR
jgi:alkanesulfonate monooxygenase SsuD/methylene tetrahydromethanopterin reductase-like flavin-dependent oxidoreductase (luciferase family)